MAFFPIGLNMTKPINFHDIFTLLREWFDTPTPRYDDFDRYRLRLYDEYSSGSHPHLRCTGSIGRKRNSHKRPRLPLKIWWPHYTKGDYRFEQIIGAILVQQTSWRQVERSIKDIDYYLEERGTQFDAKSIVSISRRELEWLVRSTGFYSEKARRIQAFCAFISEHFGDINGFFKKDWGGGLGDVLRGLKMGFGRETRDSVLLYSANAPVFVADSYSRKLLHLLGVTNSKNYDECQKIFVEGISRSFSKRSFTSLVEEYTPEELTYSLPNDPPSNLIPLVLLYQQFHAGIDELGISKRWDEFRDELLD